MIKRLLLAAAFCAPFYFQAQTILTPGDIAIIGVNTDDSDQVKFVNLVDLAPNTQIKFTDNGWNGTALTTTEGTFTWSNTALVPKGTVNTINVTAMAFSTSGDQVLVYQGAATSPTFIYGLSTRPWVTGSITANTSRRPASLTVGSTAIAFSVERDNGRYNIVTNTGEKPALLASIGNLANWTTTDTRIATFPAWTFTIGTPSNEPLSQPTSLVFSNVKTYSFNLAFTAASPIADGYLVVQGVNGVPTGDPVDGTNYTTGDGIGNGKVVYKGTATSAFIEGVIANTTYGFKVYAFNGTGASLNYRQASPLTASITTPATMEGSYYTGIDPLNASFVSDLQNKVRTPYTKVNYDQYDETMMTHFALRDTTGGQKVATCVYSGQRYNYTVPFAWTPSTPFSREHTWCVSWTPSNATSGNNEYCDQHHLFPVNQNEANAVRSNHPLGEVVTVISSYLDGVYGLDANGNNVYEPRDAHKGDAARALLYMSLRYNGVNGFDWTFDYLNNTTLPALGEDPQDVNLLLQWHAQDAPDNYEIARNDYIQSIQQNRNPWIDHPDWVNFIQFGNLTYAGGAQMPQAEAVVKSADVHPDLDLLLWPNPAADQAFIRAVALEDQQAHFTITDLTGKIVVNELIQVTAGENTLPFNVSDFASGGYVLVLQLDGQREFLRFIVE